MADAPILSSHGCRLNAFEAEAMRRLATDAGLDGAVIVNTCAVTAEAVRKARKDVRRLRRENPAARLIVTGCAAQIDPAAFAAMDGVDHVLGNADKMRAATWTGLAEGGERVVVDDVMAVTETAPHLIDGFGARARAYVQVQNGCDHRCTFCVIPYGRGNSRSVPAGAVVEQVKRLAGAGYLEIVLTGVDMTGWGADLPGRPRLGNLVRRVLRLVPDLPRLRISSIDGIEADPDLMEALATEPRLMPHLHLSLQHGDDLILKRMKRRHLRDDAIAFAEEARRLRPDLVLGADLIAGFPTEDAAAHARSLFLVEACGLTWLHAFPYSPRPGTPAARMPQVDGPTIRARAAELRAAGDAARDRHLAAMRGARAVLLMESPGMGRTEGFAETVVERDRPVGSLQPVTVTGAAGGRLLAA